MHAAMNGRHAPILVLFGFAKERAALSNTLTEERFAEERADFSAFGFAEGYFNI